MTIPAADVGNHLARVLAALDRYTTDWPAILAGMREAREGQPAASYDGTPGGNPDPTARLLGQVDRLSHDQASRDLRNARHYCDQLVRAMEGLASLSHYRRVGLPRDHKDRQPTPDERKVAEAESIDDDEGMCQSCIRVVSSSGVVARNRVVERAKLCGWCLGIVRNYGPDGPDDFPHWHQLGAPGAKPPIDLVRMHVEAQEGRGPGGKMRLSRADVEGALRRSFGEALRPVG